MYKGGWRTLENDESTTRLVKGSSKISHYAQLRHRGFGLISVVVELLWVELLEEVMLGVTSDVLG
jgi:hypothetical protein